MTYWFILKIGMIICYMWSKSWLLQHQLYAKVSKCQFGIQRMEYLGHVVLANGVEMDGVKIQAILQWPVPTTLKQLRGYL